MSNNSPNTNTTVLPVEMISSGIKFLTSRSRAGMAGVIAEIMLTRPRINMMREGSTRRMRLSLLVKKLAIPAKSGIQNSNSLNRRVMVAEATMG